MTLLTLLALAPVAMADPSGLSDLGARSDAPVALIVASPGLAPAAVDPLARRLERGGFDVWRLDLAAAPDPQAAAERTLPEAITTLQAEGRAVLVVGEGLGGRVAAQSVAAGHARPDALALLGAPLDLQPAGDQPFALVGWLAARTIPEGEIDLETLRHARWREHEVLPLLLGSPLPPLGTLPATWLRSLAAEVYAAPRVSLAQVSLPVWGAASPSDNLGPPEAMRSGLGTQPFVRLGYLNLDRREPDHAGLLTDPLPARALLRWAGTLDLAGAP